MGSLRNSMLRLCEAPALELGVATMYASPGEEGGGGDNGRGGWRCWRCCGAAGKASPMTCILNKGGTEVAVKRQPSPIDGGGNDSGGGVRLMP